MLNIHLSKQAGRFLAKIPKKHANQIVEKIDKLANNPLDVPNEPLEGYPGLRRAKSGEYRIIFRIEDEVLKLMILRVGKRNDGEVYKGLEKLISKIDD